MTVQQDGDPRPPPDLAIWRNRWVDLNKTLESLGEDFGPYGPVTLSRYPRKDTLHNLVKCLQSFAKRQFFFFYEGFTDGTLGRPETKELEEFPPEFVLQAILAQVAYDLEAILRAANQRIWGSTQMRRALNTADRLAWEALRPAKEGVDLIEDETTVLTYFQKSPVARIIPYAPVALIGIPFSAVSVPRDYLAIPHEIGHYVYRRGRVAKDPVYRILAQQTQHLQARDEVRCWREEVFADVYGSLVAGPAIVLSAQDLAIQTTATDLRHDDGEHPTPILRPDIYSKTKYLKNARAKLDEHWFKLLKIRDENVGNLSFEEAYDEAHLMSLLIAVIKEVEKLLPNAPSNQWTDATVIAINNNKKVESFYDDLEDFISGIQNKGPFSEDELEACPADVWDKWVDEERFFETPLHPDKPRPPGGKDDLSEGVEPNGKWIQIALAAGWTSEIHNHANP